MLKLEVLRRADMALINESALCLSPRVHDVLKDANAATLSEIVSKLVKDGELITLRQFAYYCNQLGIQIDATNNYLQLDKNAYISGNKFKYYNHGNTLTLEYDPQTNTNMVFNNHYCVCDASIWIDPFTIVVHVEPIHCYTYLGIKMY